MADPNDISGRQFAAARALLRMSVERLAELTGLDTQTIRAIEASKVQPAGPGEDVAALCSALEDNGIRFIPDNGGGEGVRLKFSRSETEAAGHARRRRRDRRRRRRVVLSAPRSRDRRQTHFVLLGDGKAATYLEPSTIPGQRLCTLMDMNRLLEGFFGAGNVPRAQDGMAPGGGNNPLAGLGGTDLARGIGLGNIPGGLGGVAAGGVIGLLLGNRKARKVAGKAITYGGLAAVAALAYRAWQNSRQGGTAAAAPRHPARTAVCRQRFRPGDPARRRRLRFPADAPQGDDRRRQCRRPHRSGRAGHVAAADRRLGARCSDEKAFLFDQMSRPSDPIAVARLAADEKQAAEIYLASSLAIDPDTPEEQRYLERLADALRLDTGLRGELDRQVAAARHA
jgi:uncharacterized membrane protein YebE (DUF533 family)/transcriptional regulator with XRE-family HTH domain